MLTPGQRWRSQYYPRQIVEIGRVTEYRNDVGGEIIYYVEIVDSAGRESCQRLESLKRDFENEFRPLPADGHATELERLIARVEVLERATKIDSE